MNTLFEKSIRTLELPVVLEMLASLAVSEAAKEKCRQLLPVCDLEEAARLQEETQSARERLGLYGSPSFSGVKDVSRALNRADHGGVLNTRELLDVADLLTASRRVSEYDRDRQGEKTVLDHLFSALHINKFLEDKIHGAILDEETIADSASPELADIRRKMRLAASKGRQILQRIISSPSYAKVLQEALITQRDGRFVVPVKAECKGSIPGLVHDISSSGATLFVEPMGLNRGFFTVDLRYYYKITCDAFTGCTRPMQVSGLAVFDKRAILFGSESTAKSFTSMAGCPELTEDMVLTNDLPTAVVEAVDPIILSMRLCNVCERPMCGECALTEVPAAIQAAFDEPISLENNTVRRIYLSLGQFSILRMERDAHLLIPVYDYCMPDKECDCDRCDEDPCDIFQQVSFPVGEFFPPANANAIDPLNELRKNCCQ